MGVGTSFSKLSLTAAPQLVIVWGLSFIVVLFFMLVNFREDVEFRATIVFVIALVVSIFGTIVIVAAGGKALKGKNTRFFFAQEITFKTFIIWFSASLGGSFAWAFAASNLPFVGFSTLSANEVTGLVALWGSGVIFLVALVQSRSILVPFLAHGAFNSIVFYINQTGFAQNIFRTQSLPIPEIGLPLAQVNQFLTESLFQVLLVALAEEHYKVLIIAVVLFAFRKVGDPQSTVKIYFGGFLAVFTWGILHLLQSLN